MGKQRKRRSKAVETVPPPGRAVIALWTAAFVWVVAVFFYVGVTERYFSAPASGILLFIPWTMATAAILLRAWQKYGKGNRFRFYTQLAVWGIAWVEMLFKSFINRW